jgi:hypothetical protein
MIDLINPTAKEALSQSLDMFFRKWESFVERVGIESYVERMQPVAVGWKVATKGEYRRIFATLDTYALQSYSVKVGERSVATFVLGEKLARGISVIKLIERHPKGGEKLGLDHVDFYSPSLVGIPQALDKYEVKWKALGNDEFQRISIRFGPEVLLEARVSDHTILDICAGELITASKKLVPDLDADKR